MEFISKIKTHKIKLGILTNRRTEGLVPVLKKQNIEKSFDPKTIQTPSMWPYTKPHPKTSDYMLEQLSSFKISRKEILYVGDTLEDMQAANHARVKFVGVETGPVRRQERLANGLCEDNILLSVADLPGWLTEIIICN